MKAGAFLDAVRALPMVEPAVLTRERPIVVLSPHPDDESLGCGGLIAAAVAAGQRVEVVVVTDGAGSHTHSQAYPPDRLIRLRKAEAAAAVAHLGLAEGRLTHLDLPDAHAPTTGPVFAATVDTIRRIVETSGAATLFTTWGLDPHCDHVAADLMARAVRRQVPALALWSYPIWGWHLPADDELDAPAPSGFRIDIGPWHAAKQVAIAAHESQMTDLIHDDPTGFRFDRRTIAPFVEPFEYFLHGAP